ncbi:MAG: hypothetical protein A3H35_18830 [Betaproteobacteria bacterium RIFCSPLOWO2_02_FULL_62_17]|nr:MAG: hypothetical protein A3H35_18830 [Betaproteobacteria bacterium RIFCSPLOWO2_02_FULL_62_17]
MRLFLPVDQEVVGAALVAKTDVRIVIDFTLEPLTLLERNERVGASDLRGPGRRAARRSVLRAVESA